MGGCGPNRDTAREAPGARARVWGERARPSLQPPTYGTEDGCGPNFVLLSGAPNPGAPLTARDAGPLARPSSPRIGEAREVGRVRRQERSGARDPAMDSEGPRALSVRGLAAGVARPREHPCRNLNLTDTEKRCGKFGVMCQPAATELGLIRLNTIRRGSGLLRGGECRSGLFKACPLAHARRWNCALFQPYLTKAAQSSVVGRVADSENDGERHASLSFSTRAGPRG
jgi:hypothetical protein